MAGTYGPDAGTDTISGDVVISAAGVSLQNTVITGDLMLDSGIGDGEVVLKNVAVKGTATINGGGPNSIKLENCTMPSVVLGRSGVRVVASGNTRVNVVQLQSGAILVEASISGPGFETVTVSKTVVELAQMGPVTWTGDSLTWTDVPNAAFYEVKLHRFDLEGMPLIATRTVNQGVQACDFADVLSSYPLGAFKSSVQARGTGQYLDGLPGTSGLRIKSQPLAKVATPSLSEVGVIEWVDVGNESGYIIQLL